MGLSAQSCSTATSGTPGQPPAVTATLGPLALGVNTAAWDSLYTSANADDVDRELRVAGMHLLRYPGGSWSDEYDWDTNTDTSKCGGPPTSACTSPDPLGFDAFAAQARSAGASTFVTVNYGSGTPAEAAGWMAHALSVKGDAIALAEVGNESYECHETDNHLSGSPSDAQGERDALSPCPSTKALAESYAANSPSYLIAMRNADPSALVGVPWAFTKDESAGSGVADAAAWNDTILRADGADIGFVDAHWYPFQSLSGLTDEQILDSVERIPAAASTIRATLERYAPKATFVVGETSMSDQATTLDFEPISALFAAATSVAWLQQGAQSVDWWDMNNFGSSTGGDFGLLSSGGSESEPADAPLPPYYGEEMASMLATGGGRLTALATGSPTLIGFQSDLDDRRRVLLVNADPGASATVNLRWFPRAVAIDTATYSPASATTSDPIVTSTASSDAPLRLPAQSIVVLSGTLSGTLSGAPDDS